MTRHFIEHEHCTPHDDIGQKGGYRFTYGDRKTVVLDPFEGIAFHLDLAERRFHFIHSSRTRWPSIQFGDMVFEPLMRSAQRNGGVGFHSGAISTERGAILIVGYGGEGKTTLVSGLMREGAAFVSNERSFVKKCSSNFKVFCFPDWINIGLGTVMQHPEMARLLPFPDSISLPQRRFSYGRVLEHEPSEWADLSDKIALLSDEFSSILNAPPPQSGVPIVGILRPKVSYKPVDAKLSPIEKPDLYRLLDGNVLTMSNYPDWMRWNTRETQPDIKSLSKFPALQLKFHLEYGHIQGKTNILEEIYDAFECKHGPSKNNPALHESDTLSKVVPQELGVC